MSKALLTMAVLGIGLLTSEAASAQGFRDAGAKMRGEFGGLTRRAPVRSYYYRPAPMIVQVQPAAPAARPAAPAPPAVAQTPTPRRSFSVEPSPPAQAPETQAPAATYYSTPARGSYRPSMPSYMYQKSDPRRYGGR